MCCCCCCRISVDADPDSWILAKMTGSHFCRRPGSCFPPEHVTLMIFRARVGLGLGPGPGPQAVGPRETQPRAKRVGAHSGATGGQGGVARVGGSPLVTGHRKAVHKFSGMHPASLSSFNSSPLSPPRRERRYSRATAEELRRKAAGAEARDRLSRGGGAYGTRQTSRTVPQGASSTDRHAPGQHPHKEALSEKESALRGTLAAARAGPQANAPGGAPGPGAWIKHPLRAAPPARRCLRVLRLALLSEPSSEAACLDAKYSRVAAAGRGVAAHGGGGLPAAEAAVAGDADRARTKNTPSHFSCLFPSIDQRVLIPLRL